MKKKLTNRLLTVVLALAMVFGMSITTFAAPEDVAPVNDEIVCNEGAYNVTVFGKAISVAAANTTTIIPNNVSTKIDVMVNGKLYVGMKKVLINKDEKRDRIVLEKGSYVLDAAVLTQKQTEKAVKSLLGAEAIPEMDAKSQVYMIGDNGKIVNATGVEQSTMLRTEGNYLPLDAAYNAFVEEIMSSSTDEQSLIAEVSNSKENKPGDNATATIEDVFNEGSIISITLEDEDDIYKIVFKLESGNYVLTSAVIFLDKVDEEDWTEGFRSYVSAIKEGSKFVFDFDGDSLKVDTANKKYTYSDEEMELKGFNINGVELIGELSKEMN